MTSKRSYAYHRTPIGILLIQAHADALCSIDLVQTMAISEAPSPLLERAITQLDEYFNGTRMHFDLPLDPAGTSFQKQCWQALCTIPYGDTQSYARLIDSPHHARAVGQALNRNPILIVVPCHRVVCANGALGGFRGGLALKKYLLDHESQSC